MSGKDGFARGYASANDDIRHQLIERGWFDQKTPSDAMRRDVDATIAQHEHDVSDSAWGRLPDAERGADADHGFDPYGDRAEQPTNADLYGPAREEFDAADLYGDGHSAEPQRDGVYGRDLEQDRE